MFTRASHPFGSELLLDQCCVRHSTPQSWDPYPARKNIIATAGNMFTKFLRCPVKHAFAG